MGRDWSMRQSLNTWGVSDDSDTEGPECCRKVASERKVAVTVRSLVNVKGLQLMCPREFYRAFVLHDSDTLEW